MTRWSTSIFAKTALGYLLASKRGRRTVRFGHHIGSFSASVPGGVSSPATEGDLSGNGLLTAITLGRIAAESTADAFLG